MASKVPDICDYDCPHAEFPPADTAGICRTMSAVACGQLNELVYKNTPCEWKKRGGESATKKSTKRPATKKTKRKTAGKSTASSAKQKTARKATKKSTRRQPATRTKTTPARRRGR